MFSKSVQVIINYKEINIWIRETYFSIISVETYVFGEAMLTIT